MEQNRKRALLNMTYYALMVFAILFGVFFMIYINTQTTILYIQICFDIITIAMVGLSIFDIVCTNMKKFKYIAGIILYVGSIVTLALSIISYISLSVNLILPTTQLFSYLVLMVMSYVINIFVIIQFNIGTTLIEKAKQRKLAKQKA